MGDLTTIMARRNAVLLNPTLAGAMDLWPRDLLGAPASPDAPLAGIHKARLQWAGSTPEMIVESRAWLAEHGYGTSTTDASGREGSGR